MLMAFTLTYLEGTLADSFTVVHRTGSNSRVGY